MSDHDQAAMRAGFSRRLRLMMSRRGLSVKTLTLMMGMDTSRMATVYGWLNGASLPNYESIVRLYRALNKVMPCDWGELYGE